MRVFVNGDPIELPEGATISAVLDRLDVPAEGRGLAVAVDAEVVPRGAWTATPLSDGARVEIVQAVQGG